MLEPEVAYEADSPAGVISERKLEHLSISLESDVEGSSSAGWEDVMLVHNCLPEIDFGDIDLGTGFLGCTLRAPLWITGMTGGTERAGVINARLARAAQRHGIAMGVGSQRAALVDERLAATYRVARDAAPEAVLIANIGVPQLVEQDERGPLSLRDVHGLVSGIEAQGLAIHLNWLQEMMQSEGDRRARGGLDAIRELVEFMPVPVMVKETGAGIARQQATALARAGVAAIDVGGAGGTSMVRIERARAASRRDDNAAIAATFDSWGIPTVISLLESRGCGVPVVATGGVRSGLDAARALALGAHMVGVGRPFLVAAEAGDDALDAAIARFVHELRIALFLVGARSAAGIPESTAIVTGRTRDWIMQRAPGPYTAP